MLKCVAAHWLVVNDCCLMPCSGVGLDEDGIVRRVFALADASVEPASTTFVDGYVAPFSANVQNVAPDGLRAFLLDAARKNGKSLRVGCPAELFNYSVSESGAVSVAPLAGLFTNKK